MVTVFARQLLIFLMLFGVSPGGFANENTQAQYEVLEWVDLIPKEDLDVLLDPPQSIVDIPHGFDLGALDQLSAGIDQAIAFTKKPPTPEEERYNAALKSTRVIPELSGKDIRLPGFIVPVEYNDDMVITEFFLVPYFGACIHVPPPPPNQIIYVKYPKGFELSALYDPFWIEGELLTQISENEIATSAYSINADIIKPYEEDN